jgi:hypothetical protein
MSSSLALKKATLAVALLVGGGGYCALALYWLVVARTLFDCFHINYAAVGGLEYAAQCAVLGRLQ